MQLVNKLRLCLWLTTSGGIRFKINKRIFSYIPSETKVQTRLNKISQLTYVTDLEAGGRGGKM